MLSHTQTLEGVTSLIPDDPQHYVFWDIEKTALKEDEETLRKIQQKYNLPHIYIVSDTKGSYRAWCFAKVPFKTLLSILVDSLDIIDYSFFYYTVKRKKATLRTSSKKGRRRQKVVSVLESYFMPFPTWMEKVIYDTGLVKKGVSVLLGERDG